MMINQPSRKTFRLPIAGTLLAASLLAGCASELPQPTAMVQAGGAQPAAAFAMQTASQCDVRPAGELDIHRRGEQAFVTIAVNGKNLNLLLDTGDFVTSLTPDAATRLALPASGEPGLQMTGIGGAYVAPVVEAADVQYLGAHVSNVPFPVLPGTEFRPEEHIDGLFGANFLSAYEVEMDFPAGKLRFYRHSAGCSRTGPAWVAQATRLPATDAGHNLLLIPVSINGVELNAMIDTGSEDTSITRDAAQSLGLTDVAMRGDQQITEQGLGESTERLHRF